MCTIKKSAHIKKKSGNLFNDRRSPGIALNVKLNKARCLSKALIQKKFGLQNL